MNDVMERLILAIEAIEDEFPLFIEYNDCIWECDDGELYYNTDDSEVDIFDREGDTYSGELIGPTKQIGDYTLVNVNNGCGDTITMIFKTEKEVKS